MTPDDFVDAYGEPVTITRAVSLTVTMDGAEDVEREVEQTKGIIRSPPTESMLQRLEGRINDATIQVFQSHFGFSDFCDPPCLRLSGPV